jgi:hypothetical protein
MFNYGIISANGIKNVYLFCHNKPHFMLIKISVGPKGKAGHHKKGIIPSVP